MRLPSVAPTPPMGWNSWNCYGSTVSQEKVLTQARALVDCGLSDHGFVYVNIDDGWQGERRGPLSGMGRVFIKPHGARLFACFSE